MSEKDLMFKQIVEFLNSVDNKITQRSQEWLKEKEFRVGGSILAMIQDCNKYEYLPEVLKNPKQFKNNIKTAWGTIFEDVIKKYVELEFKTTIVGDGIFLKQEYTCYSPDGLGVIEYNGVCKRVLFEFKCPFNRIPTGAVPEYYIPQVKMGLDVINVVDIGLFVEGVFRKCSLEQLNFSKSEFDRASYNLTGSGNKVEACGIIGFFDPSDKSDSMEFHDIGDEYADQFENFVFGFIEGKYKLMYSTIILNANELVLKSMIMLEFLTYGKENNMKLKAILPWKLLKVNYNWINKEKNYLEKWMPKIKDYSDLQRSIKSDPSSKDLKINEFIKKYYFGG